jgi:hypothetical protein
MTETPELTSLDERFNAYLSAPPIYLPGSQQRYDFVVIKIGIKSDE